MMNDAIADNNHYHSPTEALLKRAQMYEQAAAMRPRR